VLWHKPFYATAPLLPRSVQGNRPPGGGPGATDQTWRDGRYVVGISGSGGYRRWLGIEVLLLPA
jgi:hypothetical protein